MRTGCKQESVPWPVPDDASIIQVNGYPLAYQDIGHGPPLVLVHGSLNDYRTWINQITDFAAGHRILALSLRHYYPEQWNGTGGQFSLAQHASDVAGFVQALGIARVHLLGHSRGGAVAYLVGRDHPELLCSLVLAEPRGLEELVGDASVSNAPQTSTASIFAELHDDIAGGRKIKAARRFVESFNGAGSWDAMPALQKTIIMDNLATAVDTGELPGMTCDDIARFPFPVLLVRGANSPKRYEIGLEAMRRCNPNIRDVVVVPDAAHGMFRANPKAFNAAVLDFLGSIG